MSENALTFEYEEQEFVGRPCKVYFKDSEPPATLGAPGDLYLATIQDKMKLYGRVSDGWKVWAGPVKKEGEHLVHHPNAPNNVLWSTINLYGWFPLDKLKGFKTSGQPSHKILQSAQKTRTSTAKKRERENPSNPPSKRQKMTLALEPSPSTSFCPPPPSPSTSTLGPTLSPFPSTSVPPLSFPSTTLPPSYSPSTSFGHPPSPPSANGPRLDLRDLNKSLLSSKRRKSTIIPNSPNTPSRSPVASSSTNASVGTRQSKRASVVPETRSTPSRPAAIVSTPTQSCADEKGKGKVVQSATPVKLEPAVSASMSASSVGASASNVIDLTGLDDDEDEITHIPVPASTTVMSPKPKYDDDSLWQLDYPPSPSPVQDDNHPPTPEAQVVSVEGPLTSEAPFFSKSPSPVRPTAPLIEGLTESQRDAFMALYESVNDEIFTSAYAKLGDLYMCNVCVILHGQENGEIAIDTNDTFIRDTQVVDVHKQLLLHLLDHFGFRIRYETFTMQDLIFRLSCHLANFHNL